MRLNAGIITNKLEETKTFYTQKLGFEIVWEADWFILLATPGGADTVSFLAPHHPSQGIVQFQKPFAGSGVYFTIEVVDVDALYETIQKQGVPLAFDLRTEEWGDRHFAIIDPNNIGLDFVTHNSPQS